MATSGKQKITRATFAALPSEDQAVIRAAIDAVNVVGDADGGRRRGSAAVVPGKDQLWHILTSAAKRLHWRDDELRERYDEAFISIARQLRDVLTVLVNSGRLGEIGKVLPGIAATFLGDAEAVWSVVFSDSGVPRIHVRPRFKSAIGLIAYLILRISELSEDRPILLICDGCRKFTLIEATAGDRISRFCSSICRNRFTVRDWRRRKRVAAAKQK